jgi:hypothetical protein
MDYCTECGCCPAQPGIKLCVFCEDGLPCPMRQQRAQREQLIVTRPVLVHDAVKVRSGVKVRSEVKSAGSMSSAGNAGDNGAAELRSGSPVTPEQVDAEFAKPPAGKRIYKKRLAPPSAVQENEGETNMDRLCECGCGTPLKSRWPFIKGHGKQPPLHTRGRKSKKAQPKHTAPHKNGHAAPVTGVATLCVPEAALDNYLIKLPLEEKTAIVQKYLEGAYEHAGS